MQIIDLDLYQDRKVDFYPHGMFLEHVSPYFSTFKQALEFLYNPTSIYTEVDASNQGTLIQFNTPFEQNDWERLLRVFAGQAHEGGPQLPNDVIPDLFNDDWMKHKHCFHENQDIISKFMLLTHWRMLIIGEEDSGMFNHKDSLRTSSWQIQLYGRKKWHICGPDMDSFMYSAGTVDTFNPDYARYPEFRNATCYQFTLEPGDVVYYPKDWWHQTQNLNTPTISITGTLVGIDNYKEIQEMLQKQCSGNGTVFYPVEPLCSKLMKCYELWDSLALTAWSERRERKQDEPKSGKKEREGFGIVKDAWVDDINELNVIKDTKKEKKWRKDREKAKKRLEKMRRGDGSIYTELYYVFASWFGVIREDDEF